jgi:hypothetical protein
MGVFNNVACYYHHCHYYSEHLAFFTTFAVLIFCQTLENGNSRLMFVFYLKQCLKVVCQDMFFSRSQGTATAQSLMGQPATTSRPALEQALAPLAKKTDEKENVIGELVEMKIDGPTREEFSPQVIWLFLDLI